jgi:hypothetical protein
VVNDKGDKGASHRMKMTGIETASRQIPFFTPFQWASAMGIASFLKPICCR